MCIRIDHIYNITYKWHSSHHVSSFGQNHFLNTWSLPLPFMLSYIILIGTHCDVCYYNHTISYSYCIVRSVSYNITYHIISHLIEIAQGSLMYYQTFYCITVFYTDRQIIHYRIASYRIVWYNLTVVTFVHFLFLM